MFKLNYSTSRRKARVNKSRNLSFRPAPTHKAPKKAFETFEASALIEIILFVASQATLNSI